MDTHLKSSKKDAEGLCYKAELLRPIKDHSHLTKDANEPIKERCSGPVKRDTSVNNKNKKIKKAQQKIPKV